MSPGDTELHTPPLASLPEHYTELSEAPEQRSKKGSDERGAEKGHPTASWSKGSPSAQGAAASLHPHRIRAEACSNMCPEAGARSARFAALPS